MSYQVLYRTYRPAKFSEVIGQDYIVKTLTNAIKNNKIAHAYLFAGPRGTGKTSVAKLFAKAINCESFNFESCDDCENCKAYLEGNHPDIIEMDAASNNGVDDIREIIEQVPYAPLLGKHKVYIIDEVHMLSTPAFNALLKTLEEPPKHVIFIFATTDPQKVIPTVLSRCQRYNFSKITTPEITNRTIEILKKENITYENKAVEQIARMAEGGMRDALSLLEQCLAYNPNELKLKDIENIFGLTSTEKEVELFNKIHSKQTSEVVESLRKMYEQGMDTKRLTLDLLEIIKDALIYNDKANQELLNKITASEAQNILKTISINILFNDVKDLEEVLTKERQNQNFITYLELCFIKMSNNNIETTNNTTKQKDTTTKVTQETKEEKTNTVTEEEIEELDQDFLLSLVLDANKDLKVSDQIIYNKLDLYQYEPEKRKFYQTLIGTSLFASNKDAIIISGNNKQVETINSRIMNEELYNFINDEFGIDKMIYAITQEETKKLIELYKASPIEKRNKPVFVKKYERKNIVQDSQSKIEDLFGDVVKVEE